MPVTTRLFPSYFIFCTKKALLSEKFLFQGRERLLRVTTLNSLRSHDISLINYGREMTHR